MCAGLGILGLCFFFFWGGEGGVWGSGNTSGVEGKCRLQGAGLYFCEMFQFFSCKPGAKVRKAEKLSDQLEICRAFANPCLPRMGDPPPPAPTSQILICLFLGDRPNINAPLLRTPALNP